MEFPHLIILGITAIAAFIDARSGLIPNWLTFPAILIGPLYALLLVSPISALLSTIGIFVVGLVPYIMFSMRSMGGGDVKLFAAIGGLGGMLMGLEILMYSMIAAMILACFTMAKHGQLKSVIYNVGRIIANPFLPKKRKKPLVRNEMHQLRLGPSIFIGTGAAFLYAYGII